MPKTASRTWEAREAARVSHRKMITALHGVLAGLPHAEVTVLDQLLEQALADEYEAGYEAAYAQHPANGSAR
jgi:hypothetical protein